MSATTPRPSCRPDPGAGLEFLDFLKARIATARKYAPAARDYAMFRTLYHAGLRSEEVRLRTKVTKGAGSRAVVLAMVFKLVESAQARWRAVNAPHLAALVRVGVR